MKNFLCEVIERSTGKTLDSYTVRATDSYIAKHKAADLYEEKNGTSDNFYVDAIEL